MEDVIDLEGLWEVQKALFNLFESPGKEAHTKLIDYKNLFDEGRSVVLLEHWQSN